MEAEEFGIIYNTMLDDAAAIIHNQQVLANIHTELNRRLLNPHEKHYAEADHFGSHSAEPRTFIHAGIEITTRVLHQTGDGLRDIHGADLLYEIEGHKFALIQYKRASRDIVRNDKKQLDALLRNCPESCSNKQWRLQGKRIFTPLRIFGFCGCWFQVINNDERRCIPGCEAESIFQGQSSKSFQNFRTGMSKETFLELFASCRTGALIRSDRSNEVKVRNSWISQLLEARHFILHIIQHGFWKSHNNENEQGEMR